MFALSCTSPQKKPAKIWAWMVGKTTITEGQWDYYFEKAARAGIDAVLLECHGGYPEASDSAAIQIIQNALPFAQKYGIELHAWIWTLNRTEHALRAAHPDWYQVNALGESCLDINLYDREHYRWLCPSKPETTQYLKGRIAELAKIKGLAGIHLDFIRYPDAILPYGLHESRNVVQDRVYPQWDFCYCSTCRENFKALTGVDPLDLQDPTANEQWMQYRWDALSKVAGELCAEIKKYKKTASVAVFATPEESRKLVRQSWSDFQNVDYFFPMIYHKFYNWEDYHVLTATKEGVIELKEKNNPGVLCSGLFVGHVPKDRILEFMLYARTGGSQGIAFFSIDVIDRDYEYWKALQGAIQTFKETGAR
jgi:uncharacterized lipoprotein YddW (UPF0748 family)